MNAESDPRPAAVAFVTTEHFTLQGARAATIAEATGRATMFLSAVAGGLVALGLIATQTRLGTTFYAMALIVLPGLAFIGVATFARALQAGIEDLGYARRIALLRAYYFDNAPELGRYLLSVPEAERLHVQGLWFGRSQPLVTIAGMVAVVTSLLAGSTVGVLATLISDNALLAALLAGPPAGALLLAALTRHERVAWCRARSTPLIADATNEDLYSRTGRPEPVARPLPSRDVSEVG